MALTKVTSGVRTLGTSEVVTANIADDDVTLAKLEDGTQGDILYYGASGAPARLGFGTSGDFLKTQGTGANPVWASAGGDNTPIFMVKRITTHQSIPYDTWTKIGFNGEVYDPDDVFDSTTNYRFTVPAGEGGNYLLFWSVSLEALTNTLDIILAPLN